ncbi:MAG TPA: hypothetical protein V6D47_00550 [Oscillatoriaceae cyanobacterium]
MVRACLRQSAYALVLVSLAACAAPGPITPPAPAPRHVLQLIGFGGAVFGFPAAPTGAPYGDFPLGATPCASVTAPVEPPVHYRLNPIY